MDDMPTSLYVELKEIRSEIKELKQEFSRYKGFLGGVLWAASATGAAVVFLINWIKGNQI